ncbi:MAG TPA: N-acetylmuramic acid 6-phosphate etherase [Planctomycetota bacterium]|nr:N-acetylmuramic acid 6-phosphate etherase [Planctomycetota bacterium]
MTLPPDRSHLSTEQRNPRSAALHTLDAAGLVALMNAENRAVLDALDAAASALSAFIAEVEPGFIAGGRLIYVGAGTSGRLGVLDASEAPPTFQVEPGRVVGIIAGGDGALRKSSEGKEDEWDGAQAELNALRLTKRDALIGIAAGGTTPYALGAIRLAKAAGCRTALMSCVAVTKPADADHLLLLPTGPEVLTGSTRLKAGTATKLALNTISTALMVRAGKVYGNLMVDMRTTNAKLRDRAARIVATLTGLDRAAAFAVLDRAEGSTKTAVVMHRLGLDRAAAEDRLTTVAGRLDRLLGETSPTSTG